MGETGGDVFYKIIFSYRICLEKSNPEPKYKRNGLEV